MLTLSKYRLENTLGIAGLSKQLCSEAVKLEFLERIQMPNVEVDSDSLVHLYLHPLAVKSLSRIDKKIIVSSCYRTLAQQFILKQNLTTLVAKVGNSEHGSGECIDAINYEDLKDDLIRLGWIQNYPKNDAVHFSFPPSPDNRSATVLVFQKLWNKNHQDRRDKLSEDGRVGAKTLAALGKSPVNGFPVCSTPRYVSLGDTGKDVGEYQLVLRDLGLFRGSASQVFKEDTQDAVLAFQAERGLKQSGVIGENTRKALMG